MTSSNPTLSEKTFQEPRTTIVGEAMTIQGAVNKTAILLILLTISAAFTWNTAMKGNPALANVLMIGGIIGGLIMAMITIFKKTWSPVTAPLYAVLEGLFIGGISCIFERQLPGIVTQAVMLTFGTLAALLAAYSTGIIRATTGFRRGVIAATGGIALVYLVSMVLGFFHIQIPGIFGNGMIGIGFSVVVVIIAALNLVLDFDLIESGAQQGAPKYMEWLCRFWPARDAGLALSRDPAPALEAEPPLSAGIVPSRRCRMAKLGRRPRGRITERIARFVASSYNVRFSP